MSDHVPSAAWQRAASFAARFHAGQFRKDGRTPYVAHPMRVSLIVRHLFGIDDDTALVAALLHDVIEDTTADYDDVIAEFGGDVAEAVAALTKDMRLPHDVREAEYDRQLSSASWQARLVKLADVYDNVCDSQTSEARDKARRKVARAVACAGNDPRLAPAIEIVRRLAPAQ